MTMPRTQRFSVPEDREEAIIDEPALAMDFSLEVEITRYWVIRLLVWYARKGKSIFSF